MFKPFLVDFLLICCFSGFECCLRHLSQVLSVTQFSGKGRVVCDSWPPAFLTDASSTAISWHPAGRWPPREIESKHFLDNLGNLEWLRMGILRVWWSRARLTKIYLKTSIDKDHDSFCRKNQFWSKDVLTLPFSKLFKASQHWSVIAEVWLLVQNSSQGFWQFSPHRW